MAFLPDASTIRWSPIALLLLIILLGVFVAKYVVVKCRALAGALLRRRADRFSEIP